MISKKREWNKNKEIGIPYTVIDNFIDEETCLKLYEECISAPKGGWTVFTRAGSRMEEFNDLISCPTAHQLTYDLMHSGEMLYDLEQMTGIVGLMPDPHLVGAGFSIFRDGSHLGCHYDFNWNDRLRLHRKLTSLLFITPDWEDDWGGHHQLYTGNVEVDKKAKLVHSVSPKFNRFIISQNIKEGPYHSVSKVNCPDTVEGRCAIRFFYYISTSEYDPNDPPHRSTYSSNDYAHSKLYEEEVSTSHFVGEGGEEY
jgi:Rps23 Pro-64 3,4-dihydroxylase Tpa1-like proline 4-hydroxylase